MMHKKRMADIFKGLMEFINFSFVGITTFSVQIFLTLLLTEIAGIPYYASYAVALVIAWSINFGLNMNLTFSAKGHVKQRIEKFAALLCANAILNWALVVTLVTFFHLHYFPAILVVTATLAAVNFFVEDLWVFKNKPVKKSKNK